MQVIVELEFEAGAYVSEQYQSRINAPSVCPNCGIAQGLEAHGYYWRWVSEARCGRVLRMAVRRFLSVLRGDGQLSAALCAALSARSFASASAYRFLVFFLDPQIIANVISRGR